MNIALKEKTGNRASFLVCKGAVGKVRSLQREEKLKSTSFRKTVKGIP